MGTAKHIIDRTNENKRVLRLSRHSDKSHALDFSTSADTDIALGAVAQALIGLVVSVADGEVTYITIGKSRDAGAVLITINSGEGKDYAGGWGWRKLAAELADLGACDFDL